LIKNDARAIPCSACSLPSVEVRNGALIVKNRHHGKVHLNVFSLQWLKDLLERASQAGTAGDGAEQ
jgi:hypothetical protein